MAKCSTVTVLGVSSQAAFCVRFLGPNIRFRVSGVSEVGYGTEMMFIIIQSHKFLLLRFSFSVPYLLSEREKKTNNFFAETPHTFFWCAKLWAVCTAT